MEGVPSASSSASPAPSRLVRLPSGSSIDCTVSASSSGVKPRFTHFLSVPLGSDDHVRVALEDYFRRCQTNAARLSGYHRSIAIDPRSLHLTIGMLSLPDAAAREAAQALAVRLTSSLSVLLDALLAVAYLR